MEADKTGAEQSAPVGDSGDKPFACPACHGTDIKLGVWRSHVPDEPDADWLTCNECGFNDELPR